MADTENKKTATERLEDLEKTMNQLLQFLQPLELLTRDVTSLKEDLKQLSNKQEALIKALSANGHVTEDAVQKLVVEGNAKELIGKVTQLVAQGVFSPSDTVTNDSFVVINEADSEGNVINPRIQFLVSNLQNDEVRGKLGSAKVGDNLPVGDKGFSLNVLESYDVITPTAPEAVAPAAEQAAAPAAEAPPADAAEAAATESATA